MNQNIFQRIEKKYLMDEFQYRAFLAAMENRIEADRFGLHTIHNIYYDTPQYELIRNSLEKPRYKEKFRLRGYGEITNDSLVFLEIKKKYQGVVYKRRIDMPFWEAKRYLELGIAPREEGQIFHEIDYFFKFYRPVPKVYLAYDRVAYVGREDSELRITIDRNIRSRYERLDLNYDEECCMLNEGKYLMEIKVPMAYPVWLADILSELCIYPVSFSKYGAVYSYSVLNGEIYTGYADAGKETAAANEKRSKMKESDSCLQVY